MSVSLPPSCLRSRFILQSCFRDGLTDSLTDGRSLLRRLFALGLILLSRGSVIHGWLVGSTVTVGSPHFPWNNKPLTGACALLRYKARFADLGTCYSRLCHTVLLYDMRHIPAVHTTFKSKKRKCYCSHMVHCKRALSRAC